MTTTCWSNNSLSIPIKPLIFLMAIILAVATFVAAKPGTHANKHSEADDIRSCLSKNGPSMVYKAINDPTWYLVCQLSDTKWGIQAVTKNGYEKTAFSPGDGSFDALKSYLDKFATRWKQNLPWVNK